MAAQKRLAEKTINAHPASDGFSRTAIFNIGILAVVAVLFLFYVIGTNEIVANNYKAQLLNDKLSVLNETTANLILKKNSFDNSARVLEFAQGHSMVEAKNITYLFENREVAIQR